MYKFIKIYFDHFITVNCNYICISNQNKVQYMCQDYNVIDSKNSVEFCLTAYVDS